MNSTRALGVIAFSLCCSLSLTRPAISVLKRSRGRLANARIRFSMPFSSVRRPMNPNVTSPVQRGRGCGALGGAVEALWITVRIGVSANRPRSVWIDRTRLLTPTTALSQCVARRR